MKNTLLTLLGFVLLTPPLAATAQQIGHFGDFTYSSDGTNVTITAYAGPGGTVTIPGTITSLPVTSIENSIGTSVFDLFSPLTSVTIPDTVTSIGQAAFRGCTGLTNVTIGSGVTSMGDFAFGF